MKKVLFVATVTSHINRFHIPYLKYFKDQNFEVHVASKGRQKIPYCDKHYEINFERSPFSKNNLKAYKELKKIIDNENYDIIHCHTPVGGVLTRLAAKKSRKNGTKVIYTAHGFHFFKGAPIKNWIIFYPIEKMLSKYTDCVITMNQEDYDIAKRKFKKTKVEYVNGVGIEEKKYQFELSKEEKEQLRKDLDVREEDFVLFYPAEISNRKNQLMLISVVKELEKTGKKVILLLAGKDSLNGTCQAKAKELKIENRIRFLGYRNDVNKIMKIANIAVSSSVQEGLPVNIMEALASGLTVIATNCRGNRDIIDNTNGKLVEINDILQMAKYIEEEMNKSYVNVNNKTKLDPKYKIENVLEEYKEIYQNVCNTKVMHILNSKKFSGAEKVAIDIIKITNLEDEIKSFYMSPEGEIEKKLEKEEIQYIGVQKLSLKNVKKVCKEYSPDIIHAHDFKASIFSVFANKKVRLISHIHKNDPRMKKINIFSIIYLLTAFRYNKIIFVSESIEDEFIFRKILKDKIQVMPNPINTAEIWKKSNEYSVECKYDIIYLGRLSKEKNPLEFISVVEKIKKQKNNIQCAMIGDGPLKEECIKKIHEYNLESTIKMMGFIENPYPIIKNAKIMCITSSWEGFGIAAVEALTLGTPVVAKKVGGLTQIIDSNCGYLVKDEEDAKRNIIELLTNERILNEKSKNAKKRAEKFNNIEEYKKQILKIYGER